MDDCWGWQIFNIYSLEKVVSDEDNLEYEGGSDCDRHLDPEYVPDINKLSADEGTVIAICETEKVLTQKEKKWWFSQA